MKKILAGLLVLTSVLSFGCMGRSSEFGVVDMQKVQAESTLYKTLKEEIQTKGIALQGELEAEVAGKSREDAEKIVAEKTAQLQVIQSDAQNKLKASLDAALAEVAKEKKLGAVLVKEAVPQGGVDVTDEVIQKMK